MNCVNKPVVTFVWPAQIVVTLTMEAGQVFCAAVQDTNPAVYAAEIYEPGVYE